MRVEWKSHITSYLFHNVSIQLKQFLYLHQHLDRFIFRTYIRGSSYSSNKK